MKPLPEPVGFMPAAFTLVGSFSSAGQTLPHVQYLTNTCVLTEFENSAVLVSRSLGGRFIVDRARRHLRPIVVSSEPAHPDHLRTVIGSIVVDRSEHTREIDGFTCRLYSLRNENGRIRITAEAWCTRVEGVEATALRDERALDAELHPFSLPLEADEIVVRLVMRMVANGSEQVQTYRLHSFERGIANLERVEDVTRFPIVRGP